MKVCYRHGHMTNVAAMVKNSKSFFLKIFSFRTRRHMILKDDVRHQEMELYKVNINPVPGMTLTYLTARTTHAAHAFEWGKLLKCHLKGKRTGNGKMD